MTNQRFSRVNTFNLIVLATQLIAGYLILQWVLWYSLGDVTLTILTRHVYNTLFNSFLTNYFDPLNPDIYVSEYADNRAFRYRGLLDRFQELISVISNEYIYGRPWPPS